MKYDQQSIQKLIEAYENLELHKYYGATIHQKEDASWVWRMTIKEKHAPSDYLHGGITYALMDVAAAYALEAHNGPFYYTKTVDASFQLLKSPKLGATIEFRTLIDRVGRSIANARMEVWEIEPVEQLVATGSIIKQIFDRREKPRPNDLDPSKL